MEGLEIVTSETLEEEIVTELEEIVVIEVVMVVHSDTLLIEIQIIVFKVPVGQVQVKSDITHFAFF